MLEPAQYNHFPGGVKDGESHLGVTGVMAEEVGGGGGLSPICTITAKTTLVLRALLRLMRSPARSLGFTILGEPFLVCDPFFGPTIEVVTFRLCGC